MPAAPMAWIRQQFFDNNGAPLSSGSLEFFDSGTSTPRAVFSDADLSVSAGLVVTLNSAGFPQVSGTEVTLFLSPVAYRVVVKNSAGTTLRTVDGVYALQAASSVNLDIADAVAGEALTAGDLCYLSDGSNSLTAGRWYKADADFYYASIHPVLGFATAAISSGAQGTIRIGGVMTGLSGLSAGLTYYVSATAAAITSTAQMNARSVGVAISATTLRIDIGPQWIANGDPLSICDGRLTLTSGTAVTTSDVTGATSVYFTPYDGNRIALFDGNKWKVYPFTERSLALGTLTSGLPYDVFIYDNSGTLTLEFTAWTNTSTRATALALQDGVQVKTGALTRRWLGSFQTTSTTTTEDSFQKRLVHNRYNKRPRPLRRQEGTSSWTYTSATIRQANGSTSNQVEVMSGEIQPLELVLAVQASNTNDSVNVQSFINGPDSTTSQLPGSTFAAQDVSGAGGAVTNIAVFRGFTTLGYHYYVWAEYSEATGTTTWEGGTKSGLEGMVWQ